MDTIIFEGVQIGKNRKQYTKEFKVETVCLIVEEGRRVSEVERDILKKTVAVFSEEPQ